MPNAEKNQDDGFQNREPEYSCVGAFGGASVSLLTKSDVVVLGLDGVKSIGELEDGVHQRIDIARAGGNDVVVLIEDAQRDGLLSHGGHPVAETESVDAGLLGGEAELGFGLSMGLVDDASIGATHQKINVQSTARHHLEGNGNDGVILELLEETLLGMWFNIENDPQRERCQKKQHHHQRNKASHSKPSEEFVNQKKKEVETLKSSREWYPG